MKCERKNDDSGSDIDANVGIVQKQNKKNWRKWICDDVFCYLFLEAIR